MILSIFSKTVLKNILQKQELNRPVGPWSIEFLGKYLRLACKGNKIIKVSRNMVKF